MGEIRVTRYKNIVIYNHPNPEMKSFLMNEEISTPRVEHFNNRLSKDSEERFKHLGHIGAQVVREVMAIPGVQKMRIKPKDIQVKKEESASWQEIEVQVIEILNRALRKKKIKVIKH